MHRSLRQIPGLKVSTFTTMAVKLAALEEGMSTHKAEYESALDRFRANMGKRDARHARREV